MRLLFIRHADPDYAKDSLTPKGDVEAKLLAKLAPKLHLGTCYVSPLGRAQRTASYSLQSTGKTAETKDWLREFDAAIDLNRYPELINAYGDVKYREDGTLQTHIVWDLLPSYLMERAEYYDNTGWRDSEIAHKSNIVQRYDYVTGEFDRLLAEHGYLRDGRHYSVERGSTETLTFFCHFGVESVLLSHLWNISPFIPWHSMCMLPSSVTEVVSEERQKGYAIFRSLRAGDTTHLTMGGERPSSSARFTEIYSDMSQRHGSVINSAELRDNPANPPMPDKK